MLAKKILFAMSVCSLGVVKGFTIRRNTSPNDPNKHTQAALRVRKTGEQDWLAKDTARQRVIDGRLRALEWGSSSGSLQFIGG